MLLFLQYVLQSCSCDVSDGLLDAVNDILLFGGPRNALLWRQYITHFIEYELWIGRDGMVIL